VKAVRALSPIVTVALQNVSAPNKAFSGLLAGVKQTDTNAWDKFGVADEIDWRRGCSEDENKITVPAPSDSPAGLNGFGWN
jgi:hypothetical protein